MQPTTSFERVSAAHSKHYPALCPKHPEIMTPLPKDTQSKLQYSASADYPEISLPKNGQLLVSIEETKSTSNVQLLAAAAAACVVAHATNPDAVPCLSSCLSRRSSSTNFLLSQGSSLASLPSLGLSLNAGSSDCGGIKAQLLQAVGGAIIAHCSCNATLQSTGDQVASLGEGVFYSAASSPSSAGQLALNTCSSSPGNDFYQVSSTGLVPKKEKAAVKAIVVAGGKVFTSHSDLKIRVWERSEGKKRSCAGGGDGGDGGGGDHKLVTALPTHWDCMATSLTPGGYTHVRRHHRKLWIQHADTISAISVDAKQGFLYSASWDRSVKVWRLRDLKCVESFRAHDDAINALALSADGFLYTASADGKVKVWAKHGDTLKFRRHRRHSLVATLEAHRSAVNALALSPDGSLLYSGACDKAIVVWEREEGVQHAVLAGALRGHRHAVLSLATCANTLCSGSADKSIRVWHRLGGRLHVCLAVLQGHSAPVKSLSLSLMGDLAAASPTTSACLSLYSAALDHEVRVWQLNLSFTR